MVRPQEVANLNREYSSAILGVMGVQVCETVQLYKENIKTNMIQIARRR